MSFLAKTGVVVVYDTEFTSWDGFQEKGFKDHGKYPEVIQIGAVKLNADVELEETAYFSSFVRPLVNPILSPYIIELTGIQQCDVDERGLSFGDALGAFERFVGRDADQLWSFGRDGRVLQKNRDLNGITDSGILSHEQNLREAMQETNLIPKDIVSALLPEHFGLDVNHGHHNALEDARAVAAVLRHLRHTDIV